MKMGKLHLFPTIFAITLLLLFGNVINLQATTVTWLGGNTSWLDAASWDTGMVPGPADDVIIPSGYVRLYSGETGFARSVEVQSGARLYVYSNGELNISDAVGTEGLHVIGRAYIYGRLTIENINGTFPNYGRGIYNEGYFYIFSNGFVEIISTEDNGITNSETGYFYNRGEIWMESIDKNGIFNRDRFRNYGSINIDASLDYPDYGIVNFDDFRNYSNGEITIDGGGGGSFGNNTSTATLRNYGSINLNNSSGIGINNNGVITNYSSGFLKVHSAGTHSFYNNSAAIVTNHGTIRTYYGGSSALVNDGQINNYNYVNIFYCSSISYYSYAAGSFDNYGSFYSLSNDNTDLYLQGSFINHDDAYTSVNKTIMVPSGGELINDGILISYKQSGNHWNGGGIMVNNGAIEDRYLSFPSYVMDNQQVIVEPLTGPMQEGVPFPDALNVASLSNVTVLGWKVSKNGGSAGTYDPVTNEFTPNAAAVGLSTLYVTIEIDASGINRNFIVEIDGGILPFSGSNPPSQFNQNPGNNLPQSIAQHELLIYPNPSSGQVQIESKYFEEQATEIQVFNALGQLVHQQKHAKGILISTLKFPAHLLNGIYMIQCSQEGKVVSVKRTQLQR